MGATEVVKHSLARTMSVVCTLLVMAGVGWAVYAGIIRPVTKPNPTTTQHASRIENNYNYPAKKIFGCGITLLGADIGVTKYDYSKPMIVQKEIK